MSKLKLILLGLALSAGTAHPAQAARGWDATLPQMDALFDAFMARTHAPGLVYGVVREGKLVHLHVAGVQDLDSGTAVSADTVFRIASLTKSFTALAVLQLQSEGRLDLDAPVELVVPELKGSAVRPRQLLNHSAGFVTDDPWADRQLDMSESAFSSLLRAGIPAARVPGTAFDYSNMGYAVLGRAISNASGQRYQDYITGLLLRPLGMTATVWEKGKVSDARRARGYSWIDDRLQEQPSLDDGAFGAVAGLSTNAQDYARYVAWLLSAWSTERASSPRVIDPAIVREAGRGAILSQVGQRRDGPDGKACPVAWMYGAGFYVVTDCELGTMLRHPGGLPGYGSQVLLLPQAGIGLFAFANLTYAHLSDPVVEAAVLLERADLLRIKQVQPNPALARAADAVLRMVQAGDVAVARAEFATNLLLDSPVERRNAELRRARDAVGTCTSIAPVEIAHALGGRFELACERGPLPVMIFLAPTSPPGIQYIEFELPAPADAQRPS